MYLFFDTETTGLPRNWKAPVTDLGNWPRLVQLAYVFFDAEWNELSSVNSIIKPAGFTIPAEASRIHGISTERAEKEGKDLKTVLRGFQDAVGRADYLIAHNISFDEKIVGAEFLRNQMPDSLPAKKKICTMQSTTDFCGLPGPYGFKWPKLAELYSKLFQAGFEGEHDAAADVKATIRCFRELVRRDVIKL